jgi:uncharacterized Ntn-hydrolase superfamily protein
MPERGEFHTFSVVGRCTRTGDFGVAVATARPAVGSVVPWAGLTGAVATQARTNTAIGRSALALLERDVPVAVALETLLASDPDREHRQAHGVDRHGGVFAHTGTECVPWCGHRPGDGFSVAGNMLAGPEVLAAMSDAFSATPDMELAARLLGALEAGQAAGGDKRGKQSAALLVVSAEPRAYHNLRVDDHAEPVAELRRLFELTAGFTATLLEQYGDDGLRRYRQVKR